MVWNSYGLDRIAQELVHNAKDRDLEAKKQNPKEPGSLNQAHKMRMTIAYGLERFWGEHLRLKGKKASDENKSRFWKETWDAFCTIMEDTKTGINLPKDLVRSDDMNKIRAISKQLWELPVEKQRVAIAVLTQLCDCIVWWTQRYKGKSSDETNS